MKKALKKLPIELICALEKKYQALEKKYQGLAKKYQALAERCQKSGERLMIVKLRMTKEFEE